MAKTKGKAPADQWYYKDWLADTELHLSCLTTRGIWADLLAHMWGAAVRGKLSGPVMAIAGLAGASKAEMDKFIEDAQRYVFCDVTVSNGEITIINRRMYREAKEKNKDNDNNRKRQQDWRDRQKHNADNNGDVTPSSSSPSPTPVTEDSKTPPQPPQNSEAAEPPGGGGNQKNLKLIKGQKRTPPYEAVVEAFHSQCPMLTKVIRLTKGRRDKIKSRCREDPARYSAGWWEWYFGLVPKQPFLLGKETKRNWKADFDYLIKSEEVVTRTIEKGGAANDGDPEGLAKFDG